MSNFIQLLPSISLAAAAPPPRYIAPSTTRISTLPSAPWSRAVIFMLMASGFMLIDAWASTRPVSGTLPVIR